MKLPNFFEFSPLNTVKSKMGIPLNKYGNLDIQIDPARLSELELEKLVSQDGLDISIDDLSILSDGTLAYKDSRVILYIRDVTVMNGRESQPKFHLANCRTLQNMRENNRFERYVVSTRVDGNFKLNMIRGKEVQSRTERLHVCQNCLNLLAFDGFSRTWKKSKRVAAVEQFKIDHFFDQYPRSLHIKRPKNTSITAPLNIYSKNFSKLSRVLRENAKWVCEQCHSDFSSFSRRKWLHVHHRDGQKSNNNKDNLVVLCIRCHAEQPVHKHMKNTPEYKEFLSEELDLRFTQNSLSPNTT